MRPACEKSACNFRSCRSVFNRSLMSCMVMKVVSRLLGRYRIGDREQDIYNCAIEGTNPGFFAEIPAAFEVSNLMTRLAGPGAAAKMYRTGFMRSAALPARNSATASPVYFPHAHDILGVFDKVRIPVEVGRDVAYAVCLQLVKGLARATESTRQRAVGRY